MQKRLAYLQQKHAELDAAVGKLTGKVDADSPELKKMKFKKYLAKTQIAELSQKQSSQSMVPA